MFNCTVLRQAFFFAVRKHNLNVSLPSARQIFTLSCAEKRWMENLHVILKRQLGDVAFSYKYKDQDDKEDTECEAEVVLLINDIPLEDYLKLKSIDLNVHEEMRKNVLPPYKSLIITIPSINIIISSSPTL